MELGELVALVDAGGLVVMSLWIVHMRNQDIATERKRHDADIAYYRAEYRRLCGGLRDDRDNTPESYND